MAGTSRSVLICVDASEQAERAFDYYSNDVHHPDTVVLILHVAEPLDIKAEEYEFAPETYFESTEKVNEAAKVIREKYNAKLRQRNMTGTVMTKVASRPGETVVEEAKKEKVKLVVLGTRGMGTIRRTILGSVSDYVVHHAHCPVLIFRK